MNFLLLNTVPPSGGPDMLLIMMIAFIAIIGYQVYSGKKRNKETVNFLDALNKGANVVTNTHIHGKVAKVDTDTLILEIESGARFKINKSGISKELTEQAYK